MYRSLLLFTLLLIVAGSGNQLSAQEYHNAVGLRLGYPLSVSYKHNLNEVNAVEVTASTYGDRSFYGNWRWFALGAGYLIHNDLEIAGIENLRWYYGAGASAYFYSYDDRDRFLDDDDYTSVSFGIQGYIGLEYTSPEHPINITLDWTPVLAFGGFGGGFGAGYAGIGVRYVLNR